MFRRRTRVWCTERWCAERSALESEHSEPGFRGRPPHREVHRRIQKIRMRVVRLLPVVFTIKKICIRLPASLWGLETFRGFCSAKALTVWYSSLVPKLTPSIALQTACSNLDALNASNRNPFQKSLKIAGQESIEIVELNVVCEKSFSKTLSDAWPFKWFELCAAVSLPFAHQWHFRQCSPKRMFEEM